MVYQQTADLNQHVDATIALTKVAIKEFKAQKKEIKRAIRPQKRMVKRSGKQLHSTRDSGDDDTDADHDFRMQSEALNILQGLFDETAYEINAMQFEHDKIQRDLKQVMKSFEKESGTQLNYFRMFA